MNKQINTSNRLDRLPKARIKKSRFTWLVWGFPIAAALFVAFLLLHDFRDDSRMITVVFKNTDGVEPGNTQVKCRGADVGIVKKVTLSKDHLSVSLGLVLKGPNDLARVGSLFWVVRPEVGAGMVTGLQTVMSGSYISMRPGDGPHTNNFTGLEMEPPERLPGNPLAITLIAPNLSSLQPQSPVYYRGIEVGQITDFQLGDDAQEVVIHALIAQAFAPLVQKNTVFWNAGGIDFNFSLFHGLNLSADSAKSLIAGAVEFATPDDFNGPAAAGTTFRLFEKPLPEWKTWRPLISLHLPGRAPEGSNFKPIVPAPPSFKK